MYKIERVLFVAHHARGERIALQQAIQFADKKHASVTVMDVVQEVSTNDPSLNYAIERIQRTLVEERKAQLAAMVGVEAGCRDGPEVRCEVVPGSIAIEVMRAVVEHGYDLVVKSADAASAVTPALFATTDLRLLRMCPCPVWIMKPDRHVKLRRILAAVDPRAGDEEARKLGSRIVHMAADLARTEQAELHILHAWEHPLEERLHELVSSDELELLEVNARRESLAAFERLLAEQPGVPLEEHFVDGKAARTIIEFVDRLDIDLVVMGTLALPGIWGRLIGLTAERVLHEIACSVLTLKPAEFRTPEL